MGIDFSKKSGYSLFAGGGGDLSTISKQLPVRSWS
jgi:hypothetical protein